MSTLRFDGSGDKVDGTGQGAMNGAITIAALFQRSPSGPSTYGIIDTVQSGAGGVTFGIYNSDKLFAYISGMRIGVTAVNSTDWYVLAITVAAYPGTPVFHLKNITTGSTWVHENANSAASSPPVSAVGNTMHIGVAPSVASDMAGDLAVIGWWNQALSNSQIETLAANKKTSDWHALTPASLTELNTLTPTDLEALMTWTVVGPTLTGANPTGWTFDGVGAPPTPEPEPADIPIRIRSSTGWIDLSGGGDIEFYEQEAPPETETLGAIWVKQEPMP